MAKRTLESRELRQNCCSRKRTPNPEQAWQATYLQAPERRRLPYVWQDNQCICSAQRSAHPESPPMIGSSLLICRQTISPGLQRTKETHANTLVFTPEQPNDPTPPSLKRSVIQPQHLARWSHMAYNGIAKIQHVGGKTVWRPCLT